MKKIAFVSLALALVSLPAFAERNESRSTSDGGSAKTDNLGRYDQVVVDQYGNAHYYRNGQEVKPTDRSSGGDRQSGSPGAQVSPKGDEY